jgi:hypothetical protein
MSGSSTSAAAVYECRIVTNVNICSSSSSSSFWLLSPPRIGSVNQTKREGKKKL